jgi:hypothetical protein
LWKINNKVLSYLDIKSAVYSHTVVRRGRTICSLCTYNFSVNLKLLKKKKSFKNHGILIK